MIRPTNVEVDLDRLAKNYCAIADSVAPAKVMAILKANAYGHGLVPVARHLESLGADYFGVALLEEGVQLRESGIKTPVLVLGGIIDHQMPLFLKNDLTMTASSIDKLRQINEAAQEMNVKAKIHLKIDTGMGRIGVHYYSADSLLEESLRCPHVEVEGVFSHFANSDALDLDSAQMQLRRFEQVLSFYDDRNLPYPPLRHMANSGAILQLPDSYLDMVRPGIMLYGVYPSEEVKRTITIQPILSWKSRVVFFKVVKPNHPVSYGSTWQSDRMTRVVTVPVGYGDGYFRAMSERAEVVIRGKRYPVIGRICMDQIMVNIGWETAYNNDEVILLGHDSMTGASITCEELANWANTIPYEVLTNINTRVPRVYIGGK